MSDHDFGSQNVLSHDVFSLFLFGNQEFSFSSVYIFGQDHGPILLRKVT